MESEQSTPDGRRTSKNYFVFIDESGDLGKSASSDPYLVFAASVTDEPEFAKIIDKYKTNTYLSQSDEIKFSKTRHGIRLLVIDDVLAVNLIFMRRSFLNLIHIGKKRKKCTSRH